MMVHPGSMIAKPLLMVVCIPHASGSTGVRVSSSLESECLKMSVYGGFRGHGRA